MSEEAILKINREKEWITSIESEAKEFTVLELDIVKSGSLKFYETEITSLERAFPECGMREINM